VETLKKLLNDFEELVEESSRVPLTKKVLIEEEELTAFLENARNSLPEEVMQAQWIVDEREKILNEAKEKAAKMLAEAEDEANRRIDESNVVMMSNQKAEQLVSEAKSTKAQIIAGSKKYALDCMNEVETSLSKALELINTSRRQLAEDAPARISEEE